MRTNLNFGKVAPDYRAFTWFGRPLLLSSRTQGQSQAKLDRIIDVELARGCDGFVLRITAKSNDAAFDKQIALFEATLQSYSKSAFIYIDINEEGIARPVLDVLKQYQFSRGYMFASRNPKVLCELWPDATADSNFAIIVDIEQRLSNIKRCPYTTVELLDALATHERINEVHHSMKELFVRGMFGKDRSIGVRELKNIEKRVNWLVHEAVDAIITERTDLLSSMLSLGTWTRPMNGMHTAAS